ncbi:MAG: aminoglycoside phosphotransferase (APT) family kinase protein [Cryomorphaceae bacterium]|jgi:aminoglycoside phosphotransferase (APT) family kinase protein
MTDNFELDTEKLASYLAQHIDGFSGPLSASKFEGGQSNPTYLLTTPESKYVLRRKPPGELLRGAHAVDREYRILTALFTTPLPVAQALHLCDDDDVIDSMFYVMEFKEGRILWDPELPGMDPIERRDIYTEMNRVLSELHKVDIDAVGLSDYGKSGDYFSRQTHTWSKQYRAAEMQHIPAIEELIVWLQENIPDDDGLVSITHGDYRLDNMMFDSKRAEVIAVLDWELSTIGHPYGDLAYQCMQYYMPRGQGLPGLADANLEELGIPSEQEYVAMYCKRMGFESIPNWNFYLAFSMFRLAAICQGVKKRSEIGTASSAKADQYGEIVETLAKIALDLTKTKESK